MDAEIRLQSCESDASQNLIAISRIVVEPPRPGGSFARDDQRAAWAALNDCVTDTEAS